MADPMFDRLHEWLGSSLPESDLWGSNLPASARGWNSLNLKRIALALKREHGIRVGDRAAVESASAILLEKLQLEADGAFMDDPPETWGRVYPDWNARAVLVEYRQATHLGLVKEAQLAREWLRSYLAGCVLAAGSGAGRTIVDHQVARAEADRGSGIMGTGPMQPWYDPFVATCGPRGAQRTRAKGRWGEWELQNESAAAAWVAAATGLDLEVRRHSWIDLWKLAPVLDARYPVHSAPFGLTQAETASASRAYRGDVVAMAELAGWLWRTAVTFRWIRTTEGVLMQRDRARGSSTADLDACSWRVDGTTTFLCGDPGWRHSDEPEPYVRSGSCHLEVRDGVIWGIASRDGRQDVEVALLGGQVLFDATTGPDGPRVLVPSTAAGGGAPGSGAPAAPAFPALGAGAPGAGHSDLAEDGNPVAYHQLTAWLTSEGEQLVTACAGRTHALAAAFAAGLLRNLADQLQPPKRRR